MIEKYTLKNGVRIVTEHIPHVRSCAAGIWVSAGARYETKHEQGISHFIEHMMFKGTASRTAADIAMQMDAIGGQMNAYTTKEHTCYYAKTLDIHLPVALDILCDMFFNSRFDDNDLALERGVILEEIGMYADSPDDLCVERLLEGMYKGSDLGHSILGYKRTLDKMTGQDMRNYIAKNYRAGGIVIAIAGNFSKRDIDFLKLRFETLPSGNPILHAPAMQKRAILTKRKTAMQNHICMGFPGFPVVSDKRYAYQIFNGIFGGGMSSRLFQEIRENRGLCYSVFSQISGYLDSGVWNLYVATNANTEVEALCAIKNEILKILQDGAREDELSRVREQIKANVLMGLESVGTRMNHLAKGELIFSHIVTPEEIIERFDAVTTRDIQDIAREILNMGKMSFSAVGKVKPAADYENLLTKN